MLQLKSETMSVHPGSYLVFNKAAGVFQRQVVFAHAAVSGSQSQTAQGVPASSIFSDHRHQFFLDARGQGHLVTAYTDVCAPVNHSLGGTLWAGTDRGMMRTQKKKKKHRTVSKGNIFI